MANQLAKVVRLLSGGLAEAPSRGRSYATSTWARGTVAVFALALVSLASAQSYPNVRATRAADHCGGFVGYPMIYNQGPSTSPEFYLQFHAPHRGQQAVPVLIIGLDPAPVSVPVGNRPRVHVRGHPVDGGAADRRWYGSQNPLQAPASLPVGNFRA